MPKYHLSSYLCLWSHIRIVQKSFSCLQWLRINRGDITTMGKVYPSKVGKERILYPSAESPETTHVSSEGLQISTIVHCFVIKHLMLTTAETEERSLFVVIGAISLAAPAPATERKKGGNIKAKLWEYYHN